MVHCTFILPVAAFLVTRELHQERLAIFCPFEESKVFNDCAAPGIQSNQMEDLNPVPAVYLLFLLLKGRIQKLPSR